MKYPKAKFFELVLFKIFPLTVADGVAKGPPLLLPAMALVVVMVSLLDMDPGTDMEMDMLMNLPSYIHNILITQH